MRKTPRLIDTHCHLEMPQFDKDREAVIERALGDLDALITIGTDLKSNEQAIRIAEGHESIFCSVGLHPHDAKDFDEETYLKLREWAAHEKVVAIGETGLDYHYDHSPRPAQREAMRRQLALAIETDLPAIIHSREAREDTLEIIKASGIKKGVMHCFSGDMEMAETVMSMGLYVSIAGPVTFKKSKILKEVASAVPDDYLLLETDAPYLSPEPKRGKRNEPSYIAYTAGEVAALRGVTSEDTARITSLNAARLFGIGEMPQGGEIAYKIRESLYLNITNRCTNRCTFCVRFNSDFVKGHNLRLKNEPTLEELKAQIGNPRRYAEIVFCGYGEPLLRLEDVIELSGWIKQRGGRVRINTNGHGNIIHGRNILPELEGLVDSISVSLNAHNAETYDRICLPEFKGMFDEVLDFIREAKKHIPDIQLTAIDMEGVDIEKCRKIAEGLSVKFRRRKLDTVG